MATQKDGFAGRVNYAAAFMLRKKDGRRRQTTRAFDSCFENGHCAILSTDRLETHGVAFANGNSWRGDHFEPRLRKLIDKAEKAKGH